MSDRTRYYSARMALTGHALLQVYNDLPQNMQIDMADAARNLVGDVATSLQDRTLLPGDPDENEALTGAIYANALCMLIRWEKDL